VRAPPPTASGCKVLAFYALEAFCSICIVGLPPRDSTTYKMILTQCAVCATELGLSLGKKCGRCSTRYCGPECQVQHWKEGGHDKLCKKIKKSGGAEQYNANKRYTESVTVAVAKCADDTKGQTCYICTQALHWKTKEGLVRMCACRGTAGFAHVSCLAEQAKILVAEAEENNLGAKALDVRFRRWYSCSLCEQGYHTFVLCALGWACWKTYLGRPEADWSRGSANGLAINLLANGLCAADHYEDALVVQEAELSTMRRNGAPDEHILDVQGNLAVTYQRLGRHEESLRVRQDVYSGLLKIMGEEHPKTLNAANNYALSLVNRERFEEAKSLLRKIMPVAQRVMGADNYLTFTMRSIHGDALYRNPGATSDDLREAVTAIDDLGRDSRRVLGGAHPLTTVIEQDLSKARAALRARSA